MLRINRRGLIDKYQNKLLDLTKYDSQIIRCEIIEGNYMVRLKPILMIAVIWIAISLTAFHSEAAETSSNEKSCEVVFLLDTSASMKSQDKNRLAIDAIRQAAYSLPSNHKVGLVAYNTGIQTVIPFDTDIEQMEAQINAITYTGYTNAGEGLNQAVGLFTEEEGVNRYIVMLSDGEIDMPDRQAKEVSRALYTSAAGAAREREIKVCIVAVGSELNDPQMHIFSGAELTDGTIYWEGQSGSLTYIMERITSERLGFPRKEVGVTDAGGGNVHGEIPKGASRVKLLITGVGGFGEITANYTAESGRTILGQHFVVVDMYRPSSEAVDVYFRTSDIAGVKAQLLTEFTAVPQVTTLYRSEELPRTEEEIKKNVPPEYQHSADITIELVDAGGNRDNLWLENTFEGQEIPYLMNRISYTGKIEQGQIHLTVPADEIEQAEVEVDMSSQDAVYYVNQPVTSDIEKYPDPAFTPTPNYLPLWIVLGLLAAAIVILGVWWIKKSRSTVIYMAQPPASKDSAKKVETKSCTYSGKFNIYVVRTENGRDVPPQTIRLFGKKGGRMTLNQLLTGCGIKFGKIGAEDIIFYPGPDHSVIAMDQSERCTMLRGTEILKKGMGYPVFYNEKLTITFEDEATELEIHYKNLKPSEREGI